MRNSTLCLCNGGWSALRVFYWCILDGRIKMCVCDLVDEGRIYFSVIFLCVVKKLRVIFVLVTVKKFSYLVVVH